MTKPRSMTTARDHLSEALRLLVHYRNYEPPSPERAELSRIITSIARAHDKLNKLCGSDDEAPQA
jgi:hypothetical protein